MLAGNFWAFSLWLGFSFILQCHRTAIAQNYEIIQEKCKKLANGNYTSENLNVSLNCTQNNTICQNGETFQPTVQSCALILQNTTTGVLPELSYGNYGTSPNSTNVTTPYVTDSIPPNNIGATNNTVPDTINSTTPNATDSIPPSNIGATNNTISVPSGKTSATSNNTTAETQKPFSEVISVQELRSLLETGNVTLIDVRMPWELYAFGKIAQSVNIPLPNLKNALKINKLVFKMMYGISKPSLSNCNLIFHCKTGPRSEKAVSIAKDLGYQCPRYLYGGFNAWMSSYSRR